MLHEARWNTGRKYSPKIRHLRTIAQLCRTISLQLRQISTIEKNVLNGNLSSTCTHNMVNFGPLAAETGWRVGAPQQISTAFASWLRYCTDVAQRRSTNLWTMFGRLLGWFTIYTFGGGLLPHNGILPGAKFTLHPSLKLRSLVLAALLHGIRAVCVSQTLRRSAEGATYTRQGGHHVGHRPTF